MFRVSATFNAVPHIDSPATLSKADMETCEETVKVPRPRPLHILKRRQQIGSTVNPPSSDALRCPIPRRYSSHTIHHRVNSIDSPKRPLLEGPEGISHTTKSGNCGAAPPLHLPSALAAPSNTPISQVNAVPMLPNETA
jgi:hypothetical protein